MTIRFYKWYEKQQERVRFTLCLGFVLVGLLPISLASLLPFKYSIFVSILGLAWFGLIIYTRSKFIKIL